MQMVKESLNDGYCDISGSLDDLSLSGELVALQQSLQPQLIASKPRWGKSDCTFPRV